MAVQVDQDESQRLQATVSGDFDFAAARDLLLAVKQKWHAGARGIDITLRDVSHASSCSIGTLMLIAELAGRNFHIHLDRCQEEVHGLFNSGLLDRFFPPEVLAGCRGCFEREKPACSGS